MRLLHVSDLHIGKRVNGISMVDDQRFIFDQIIGIAKEKSVDAILITGDIYDKASPSAEAITVLDAFLNDLVSAGICVLAIPGNHDSAERIAYVQGLLEGQGVYFPPVFSGEVRSIELRDDYGKVRFWLLPFLKPGDVRRFFPEANIGDDYTVALRESLGTCAIDRCERNVILAHQLVAAGGRAPDRADDEIKLGGIDAVDAAVFDDFDYVALGHVHRPQRVGRDTVRYAGSPLKYSFSEARYPKSVVLVDVGPKDAGDDVGGCMSIELVPLAPLHDMREVRMALADLLAAGSDAGDQAKDYLHVTLTDEHPQLDAMARIHEVYPNAMSVDYDNMAIAARREHARAAIDPDELDTVDLFARFYSEQLEREMDGVQHDIVTRVVRSVEEAHAKGSSEGEEGKR